MSPEPGATPDLVATFTGPVPARYGRRRDRHGRGVRGPGVLPGPLSPQGQPRPLPRERFDQWVVQALRALAVDLAEELKVIRFAVEETPLVDQSWDQSRVPLATVTPVEGDSSAGAPSSEPSHRYQVVLFRRPIELRCERTVDIPPLIMTVLVEQLAELLCRPADEIDPRETS